MTTETDAFGAALRDAYAGAHGELILERDDGWSCPAMPPAAFLMPSDTWAEPERRILRHVTSGPVLDLGCGAGRHALYLQDRGLEVTAVDVSPGAIELCVQRGVRDARVLDLRTPPDDRMWRGILLMCGNLGLGGDWAGSRALLTRLAAVAAPDAVLVGDTVDPTQTDDPGHLAYQRAQAAAGRHAGEIGLRLRYGETVSPWWRQLNVPADDIARLVAGTGWRLEEHIRDGADQYVALVRG